MNTARYCVIIDEKHKEGWTVRRMLVARFVSQGDAVAYAMWRRDNCERTDWTWSVETVNANRALYQFAKE